MGTFPFPWEQGQHIALIGDTGTGKTTVVRALLDEVAADGTHPHQIVLRAKPDDVPWRGFQRVRRALPAIDSPKYKRILLEPPRDAAFVSMWREFAIALSRAYQHGGWTVLIDDLPFVQDLGEPLFTTAKGRPNLIKQILTMGRSVGNSVLTAMQRPVDVTRYAIGESRLTVSFMMEGRDASELAKSTSPLMGETVESLGEHEVAIFRRATREVWAGELDLATGSFRGEYLTAPRARA